MLQRLVSGSVVALHAIACAAAVMRSSGAERGAPDVAALIRAGRYDEAVAAADAVIESTARNGGDASLAYVDALDAAVRARLAWYTVATPETRALAERAVARRQAIEPVETPVLAAALERLAAFLVEDRDLTGARTLYERARGIRERQPGTGAERALPIRGLGFLDLRNGRYADARRSFERALALENEDAPPDSLELTITLHDLASADFWLGEYASAKALTEHALEIRRAVVGDGHPLVAASENELGQILWRMGRFAEARATYESVLRTYEATIGNRSPRYARTLVRLANLDNETGDYGAAKARFEQAIAISSAVFGADHPEVGFIRRQELFLLFNMGDYAGAKTVARSVLAGLRRIGSEKRLEFAEALDVLASCETEAGEADSARAHFTRAIAIIEGNGGPSDPNLATPLRFFGSLELKEGHADRALALFERTLRIEEDKLGPEHSRLAYTLDDVGAAKTAMGDLEGATQAHGRALAIRRGAFGPEHPEIANSLMKLARLDYDAGRREAALEGALQSEAIGRNQLRLTAQCLSEAEALDLAEARIHGLGLALTLAADSLGLPDAKLRAVWDALVQTRGIVLEEMALRHARPGTDDATSRERREKLVESKRTLAGLLVDGPSSRSSAEFEGAVVSARAAVATAERALASARKPSLPERPPTDLRDVLAGLADDAALVSYVRYERRRPARARAGEARREPAYLAFVARKDTTSARCVFLGEGDAIDREIDAWREAIAQPGSGREAETAARELGARVRARIWDPLAPILGDAARVLVVPDGGLHRVNLAALPADDGTYLVESGPLLHRLDVEWELAAPRPDPGTGLLAIGDPDFDQRAGAPGLPAGGRAETALYRGPRSSCLDLAGVRFDALPHSRSEVQAIHALWDRGGRPTSEATNVAPAIVPSNAAGALVLTGAEASEEAFKRLAPGRRIVHVATHGFFLRADCGASAPGTRGLGGLASEATAAPRSAADHDPSPLLLSGLVLAGANERARAAEGEDDGVLTAEEISATDLTGVEWVVLSGCETGLGEVQHDEGVAGLCRAFRVAGAQTVIMSLWAVEDEAARGWMNELYEARLQEGQDTPLAVQTASRRLLDERRSAHLSTAPFYWAGFVASGDWR